MKQTHIYLVENCYGDKNKVYIGKTINPERRIIDHKQTYGSQIMFTVIDSINSDKYRDWVPLESYWIEQFRNWGFKMMNVNTGGGGPEYYSEESKLKMSLAAIGRVNVNKGKKLSDETRLKISLNSKGQTRNKGIKKSKEHKSKMSKSHIGKKLSDETKLKISQSKLGLKRGPYKKRVFER